MSIQTNFRSRITTNGPMIFFSDPSAEIDLSQEIRNAIDTKLSFYAYRCPGDFMVSFGTSETLYNGFGTPGFVISMFAPPGNFITIPWKGKSCKDTEYSSTYSFPKSSTTFEQYSEEIKSIKRNLEDIEHGKTVAARVIVETGNVDLGATFYNMCRLYPTAFVFCFSTPLTGCWIGASPETVVQSHNGALSAMALAGTRAANTQQPWDEKNLEEQKIVADYIEECFKRHSLQPVKNPLQTVAAGRIEHLCNIISAEITEFVNSSNISDLLKDLTPTPALCGMPKQLSLDTIAQNEAFDRGCYGGFCGPYSSPEDFIFFANLRCALVEKERYALFAGGGITQKSDIETEWNETLMKATTVMNALRFENQ